MYLVQQPAMTIKLNPCTDGKQITTHISRIIVIIAKIGTASPWKRVHDRERCRKCDNNLYIIRLDAANIWSILSA